MKKLLSIIIIAIVLPFTGWAQDSKGSLVITRTDGEKISIPRSELAKITFEYVDQSGLEAVDLGLSVKWANVNMDMSQPGKVVKTPEAFGGYYGWADPTGLKTVDDVNEYPSTTRPTNIGGGEYDIATQNLGEGWRLPTKAEFEELISKCQWERTTLNDIPGVKFSASNGNWIFLPYAGYRYKEPTFQQKQYGYYWTSDRHASNGNYAADLNIGADILRVAYQIVYNGCTIRAVKK